MMWLLKSLIFLLGMSYLVACQAIDALPPAEIQQTNDVKSLTHSWGKPLDVTQIDMASLRGEILNDLSTYQASQLARRYGKFVTITPNAENTEAISTLISEDVIWDYLKILQFMSERARTIDTLRDVSQPELSAYIDIKNKKVKHLILHRSNRGRLFWDITKPDGTKAKWLATCDWACEKVLIDGYVDKVTSVPYDAGTGEVMPEHIASYTRSETCDDNSGGMVALGLCIKQYIPASTKESLNATGLHVYEKTGSPFWPKGFFPDPIPISDPIRAMSRPAPAFENLANIKASNSTHHRMFALKRGNKPEVLFLDYDESCVSISPRLPNVALEKLKAVLPGEDKYKTLCHGATPENFSDRYLRGWNVNGGDFDYASLLTPEQIEARLKQAYEAKTGNVLYVMSKLREHHPDFQTDIGHRIAPIVIDMAKNRHFDRYHGNNSLYGLLIAMPHKSMSPYVEDLFEIAKRETDAIGCVELNCSKPNTNKTSRLWKLGQIFNGGGAAAAPYIDLLAEANFKALNGGPHPGSRKYLGTPIAGLRQAASCIGYMSPKMQDAMVGEKKLHVGERTVGFTDYNFRWIQALRMTARGDEAHKYVQDVYDFLETKLSEDNFKLHSRYKREYEAGIKKVEKVLEEWSDETPYCPTRENRRTAW